MAGIHCIMAGRNGGAPPFTPVTRVYSTGTTATETAPTGATNVVIEVWGGGAGGPRGFGVGCAIDYNSDGSSGGYSRTSVAVSGGQTLVYTIGPGGKGRDATAGTSGTASSVSSGTLSITTMSAGGGTYSISGGGAGGTASGGTVANTTGNVGVITSGGNTPAPSGTNGNTTGYDGGYGGSSGFGSAGDGTAGGPGYLVFRYT